MALKGLVSDPFLLGEEIWVNFLDDWQHPKKCGGVYL
jgi:hypothetical protein